MSQNSTTTFFAVYVMAATALAGTDGYAQRIYMDDEPSALFPNAVNERRNASSEPIYCAAKNITRTMSECEPMDASIEETSHRFEKIKNSFYKHCIDFPADKRGYILELANRVCQLHFTDNLSEYNKFDETIDTVLKLSNGQTLSISQFLDEEIDAPVVFSIHRGKELLVTDEMPLQEVVNTINSVMQERADGTR